MTETKTTRRPTPGLDQALETAADTAGYWTDEPAGDEPDADTDYIAWCAWDARRQLEADGATAGDHFGHAAEQIAALLHYFGPASRDLLAEAAHLYNRNIILDPTPHDPAEAAPAAQPDGVFRW